MTYGAFGLVEVLGSANAVLVVDQMLKTADVEFRTWDTKCGGHATVFLSGDVAAVTAAVQRVTEMPLCEVIASAVISNPSQETVRLVEESAKRCGFVPTKQNEQKA
ncbi:MAG: BMC domain-containing protein [Eubacterium sp.]|nr:BMC domain-containing protein [Eubacterium sp.]